MGDALASSKRSGKSTGLLRASYAAVYALRHTRHADLPYPSAPPRKIGRNKSDEAVGVSFGQHSSPYYVYPDGPITVEALRVIGAAMAEAGVVGIGRLTLSRRERMVMVEPRGAGVALFTLRAAEEVRAAQFGIAEGEPDAEMVAIAKAIIAQRTRSFDPSAYRDRYQEALRELVEAKMKGLPIKPQAGLALQLSIA